MKAADSADQIRFAEPVLAFNFEVGQIPQVIDSTLCNPVGYQNSFFHGQLIQHQRRPQSCGHVA